MPKSKLRLGQGARKDWNGENLPSDTPFVVYLGDGRFLGPALGRRQRDRGMTTARTFRYALQFHSLEAAECWAEKAQADGYGGARVVPQSQVWR